MVNVSFNARTPPYNDPLRGRGLIPNNGNLQSYAFFRSG